MSGVPRYSARVLDLFRRLPGAGGVAAGAGAIVAGEAVALDRGAWVRYEARIERGRIRDCAFRAWGCPHLLAAAALACSAMRGCAIDTSAAIDARGLASELDIPAEKMGRLLVIEDAMQALFAEAHAVQSG